MGGVGRHVATLVVAVDGQVQSHQFNELGIVITQHLGKVIRPIFGGVNGSNARSVFVRVSVDSGGDHGQSGDQIHRVLIHVLPVFGLMHATGVSLGEFTFAVQNGDGGRKLRHGVDVAGQVVEQSYDVRW